MAGIHKRLGDRHAVAAADIQNARVGWERSGDGKRFSDAESPLRSVGYQSAIKSYSRMLRVF